MLTFIKLGNADCQANAYAGLGRLYAMHQVDAGSPSDSSIEHFIKAIAKYRDVLAKSKSEPYERFWMNHRRNGLYHAQYWLGYVHIRAEEYKKAHGVLLYGIYSFHKTVC